MSTENPLTYIVKIRSSIFNPIFTLIVELAVVGWLLGFALNGTRNSIGLKILKENKRLELSIGKNYATRSKFWIICALVFVEFLVIVAESGINGTQKPITKTAAVFYIPIPQSDVRFPINGARSEISTLEKKIVSEKKTLRPAMTTKNTDYIVSPR